MQRPYFSVHNLKVNNQHFTLGSLSFKVEQGDYVVILGPTGCGKTMLLESLAGLRRLNQGNIYLKGKAITKWQPDERGFGFTYQDHLLFPFLKVKENILFGTKKEDKPFLEERLTLLAEGMEIDHLLERYPRFLSGGEKQRVSLARAILKKPALLLLDEPLSALDPKTKDKLQELLRFIHHTERMTVVHVTHDFNEALQLGNKLIILKEGKIIQFGETKEVFRQPNSYFVASFLQMKNCIKGYSQVINEKCYFMDSEERITIPLSNDVQEGKGYLIIREEDLLVSSKTACIKDGGLSIEVTLKEARVGNSYIMLVCEGFGRWYATLSLREWRELAIDLGAKVFLTITQERVQFVKEKN